MGINSCGTTLIDEGTFKNIGAITWDTTAKTGNFTAVSGNGYFVNTTSGAITVTLPSSPGAGDVVAVADYANTFDTNNVTIARNGSNIEGQAGDFKAAIEGLSILLIYVDSTKGWVSIDSGQASSINNAEFITATGGTITTVGNFKFHRFTGPGTFTVCSVGNAAGSNSVDTVIVAGGAGGGFNSGGGGAGGLRDLTSIPVTATGYPITVGAGGAGGGPAGPTRTGSTGSNSVAALSTPYTSAGGGGGKAVGPGSGVNGGSGGGVGAGCGPATGGAGNTPPVSPSQGNPGGDFTIHPGGNGSTGGGGATTAGADEPTGPTKHGSAGGAGKDVSPNYPGQPNSGIYAGGGGGGAFSYPPGSPGNCGGAGGTGGGGNGGGPPATGFAGTTNTGGGGGGGTAGSGGGGGNGGSGIVIIKYKFQ